MIVHMIGNAHIDPIWLWRWPAGVDEALATFRSAAERCREYPEFIFTRGEAWLYRQVERLDPQLFATVQHLVASGQWHITGGQFLQPDTNMPTAAGWRRQLAHGQRYFADRFGVRPSIGYNVDVFGNSAALPDLYAEFGYTGYVFGRPDEQQVTLPSQVFRWQGAGGSELVAFRLPGTAYNTRVDDLEPAILHSLRAANSQLGHTMCFYGVGNHGGGPTRENIEFILAHMHSFPDAELRFSTPQAFFAAIASAWEHLPIVTTELQHTFPGCYSVMHSVKQTQRHAELRLAQAEAMVSAFGGPDDRATTAAQLDAAWDDLLLTQFHDVLAGTSVPSAWPDVRDFQGRGRLAAEEIIADITRHWAHQTLPSAPYQRMVAINAAPTAWSGWVEAEPSLDFDLWDGRWLSDDQGNPIPHQIIAAESPQMIHRVLFPLHIPAESAAVIAIHHRKPAPTFPPTTLMATPHEMSNGRLHVTLTATGIGQIALDGVPLLAAPGIRLHLRADHTDTWTFLTDRFTEPVLAEFVGDDWVVEETGPLRIRVCQEGWLGHSRVRWQVSLTHDATTIDQHLEVLFAEHDTLLQLAASLSSPVTEWRNGLALGNVVRVPGPTEWPVQDWSRVTMGGLQLALTTADAYSVNLNDNLWQWTLLRSPRMAWMGNNWGGGATSLVSHHGWFADQGTHTFRYTWHIGTGLDSEALTQHAHRQVQTPIVFDYYDGMRRPTWSNHPPFHLR